MNNNLKNLFVDFKDREKKLNQITRYDSYKVVFYRTDLVIHAKKVFWLTKELIPFAQKAFGSSFDPAKAEIMALVHDDHEIIMGDFEFGHKQKLSKKQSDDLHQTEVEAIKKVSELFPKMVGDYNYKELLDSFLNLEGDEVQLVKFTDKLDAYGEALHEVFGGNPTLTQNVDSEYGLLSTPYQSYIKLFSNFTTEYPGTKKLLEQNHPIFMVPEIEHYKEIALKSKPHTRESLNKDSGYFPYDFWKNTILKYATEDEINHLYNQKEFL